jgi:hypothetical protein
MLCAIHEPESDNPGIAEVTDIVRRVSNRQVKVKSISNARETG